MFYPMFNFSRNPVAWNLASLFAYVVHQRMSDLKTELITSCVMPLKLGHLTNLENKEYISLFLN